MRISCEHPLSPTTNNRGRVASSQNDSGFADTLASAVEASESNDGPPPEFSAATYRLFAAIDLERGDTEHAALHLARVPDAREAGLPLQPSGVLSDTGRWDYTEAAAALPETGRFDSATGQGLRTFIPYNTLSDPPPVEECAGETGTTQIATPDVDLGIDRVTRDGTRRGAVRAA